MGRDKQQGQKGFEVEINPDAPLFVISVASEMVGLPIWTLRKLDELGIVRPKRIGKRTRCYSKVQIEKLSYVRYLINQKGVNINGVKMILRMEEEKGNILKKKQ